MKRPDYPWVLLIFIFCLYLLIGFILGSTSIKGIPLAGSMVITLVIALTTSIASALAFDRMLILAYVLTIAWIVTVVIAGNWTLTLGKTLSIIPELLPLLLILPVGIVAPMQEAAEKLLVSYSQSHTLLILAATIISGLSVGWLIFVLKFCLNANC